MESIFHDMLFQLRFVLGSSLYRLILDINNMTRSICSYLCVLCLCEYSNMKKEGIPRMILFVYIYI